MSTRLKWQSGAFWSSFVVVFSIVASLLVVVTQHLKLPVSLPGATTPASQFSGGRSRALLERICSEDASPRNVASDGNRMTRTILFDAINDINRLTGVILAKDKREQQLSNATKFWSTSDIINEFSPSSEIWEGNQTIEFWSASSNTSGAYWQVSTQIPKGVCDRSKCINGHKSFCENCIRNIILRLRGANANSLDPQRGTLLLSAHYDTVRGTQGATDDGTGVAVLVEVARNLLAQEAADAGSVTSQWDVVVALFDGEEMGLLGSKLFVRDQHPWMPTGTQRKVLVNLEGSGSAGKAVLLRSSSWWATQMFSSVAPHPYGSSLTQYIYNNIFLAASTDTDVLLLEGFHAIELLAIDSRFNYHQHSDNIDNVQDGALQHEGANVLAFALQVASTSVDDVPEEPGATATSSYRTVTHDPSHFHSFAGFAFIAPSPSTQQVMNITLAIAMAIVVLAVYVTGRNQARNLFKMTIIGLFWTLGLVLVSIIAATVIEVCTMGVHFRGSTSGYAPRTSPRWSEHPPIRVIQFTLTVCFVWVGSFMLHRRRHDWDMCGPGIADSSHVYTAADDGHNEGIQFNDFPGTTSGKLPSCLCCEVGAKDLSIYHVTKHDVVGVLSLLALQGVLLVLFTTVMSVLGAELIFLVYTTSISCVAVLLMDACYIKYFKQYMFGNNVLLDIEEHDQQLDVLHNIPDIPTLDFIANNLETGLVSSLAKKTVCEPLAYASWVWATLRVLVLIVPSFLLGLDLFVFMGSKLPFFLDSMGAGVANAATFALVFSLFVLPPFAAVSHRVGNLFQLFIAVCVALSVTIVITIVITTMPCPEC